VVTLFLLIVFGLLLGAGIKNRLEKAGLVTEMAWDNGRRWWQVSDADEKRTDRTNMELGMASTKAGVRGVEIWRVGTTAIVFRSLCLYMSHFVTDQWVLSAPSKALTLAPTILLSPQPTDRHSTLVFSDRLIPVLRLQLQPSSALKRLAARQQLFELL
jgi:hypothetical protein